MNKLFGLFLLALASPHKLDTSVRWWSDSRWRNDARKWLFGLLLALAFLAPVSAEAATCFWVGGTATWDTTNTGGGGAGGIKWASASGGASACAGGGTGGSPVAADSATFDGSSGGGTVTVNFGGLITLTTFDMGAFTGTIDFATNNNSITLTGGTQVFSGASTKTLNMGSGTWTLSNNGAFWNCGTCANLTLAAGTSTILFSGTGGTGLKRLNLGGKTYATISIPSSTSGVNFQASGTIGTLTVSPGNSIYISQSVTLTVTTLTNVSGSSSAQTLFLNQDPLSGAATIALTNNSTCDWCGFGSMTRTGAGTITATNSFDFKNNTSITITAPSVGGGGGRIIGG